MIWEQRVEVVLMATHLVEGDTVGMWMTSWSYVWEQSWFFFQGKCARYWPDKEDCGTTLVLDNLEVSVISQEHNDFSIISRYCLKQREVISIDSKFLWFDVCLCYLAWDFSWGCASLVYSMALLWSSWRSLRPDWLPRGSSIWYSSQQWTNRGPLQVNC